MVMNEKYEKAYRDALYVLFRRGKQVGRPQTQADGIRRCVIDSVSHDDREVFKDAWGEVLAEEILHERGDVQAKACAECDRLWSRYIESMGPYLAVVRQRQIPEDGGIVGEHRNLARKAVLEHVATHPREVFRRSA